MRHALFALTLFISGGTGIDAWHQSTHGGPVNWLKVSAIIGVCLLVSWLLGRSRRTSAAKKAQRRRELAEARDAA